jgi:hypothetical protein
MLPQFDRSRLVIKPLGERVHDLLYSSLLSLSELPPPLADKAMADLAELGRRLVQARERKASILLLMGAHVIRAGVARQLIDLMERGLVTHIGMNGAGPIHDYELARIGATCESVARYIRTGEFGLWRETGEINDIIRDGAAAGLGLGEAIGKAIHESNFRYKNISVLAAGYRLGVPITVHVGIGYDILHEHPNFDPAACGTASYRDFLAVCDTVSRLEGGVFLCFGSAVMGPEVYLKALSMARNIARQEGRQIAHFTTAAFDLIPIDGDWHAEAPKSNPQYYYRPWKTILVRTVADGGESFYVCGDHRQTLPHLRQAALDAEAELRRSAAAAGAPKQEPEPDESEVVPASLRVTEVVPPRKGPAQVRKEAPPARKAEPPAGKAEAPPAKPGPVVPRRVEPSLPPPKPAAPVARKPELAPSKPQPPAPAKAAPAAAPKPAPPPPIAKPAAPPKPPAAPEAAASKREPIVPRRAAAAPKLDPAPSKATPPFAATPAPPADAANPAPAAASAENIDAALTHYLQLKAWTRTNESAELEQLETSDREGLHHSTISKEKYLRLFYRTVWMSGFASQIVLSREEEYFRVVREVLYPQGRYDGRRQGEFLVKVASVLGGSGDNRKNKAVAQAIDLIEKMGWDEFRRQYVAPHRHLADRLLELPMVGPKIAKQLLQQTGAREGNEDAAWLSLFASHHGYADAAKCIGQIAARTKDAPATVAFVIGMAGQKAGLLLKA